MKYIYTLFILVLSYCANSQCTTTMNFSVTAPTCTGCCTGSATVSHSCAVTYTWFPMGCTGSTCAGMCPGTYTVYAAMASTACCGSSVGTATVLIPAAPSGIEELNQLTALLISQSPGAGITIINQDLNEYLLELKILDLRGKIVYTDNLRMENTVTVSPDLPDGLYTVMISEAATQRRIVKKIILQQ
jgi:hypothetical protein